MEEELSLNDNIDSTSSQSIVNEISSSPLNLVLCAVCLFLIYQLFKGKQKNDKEERKANAIINLPPLKKQDMTLQQLKNYDGRGDDKRILIAVNGKVFDVTKGCKFYGPDGPYGVFAGCDASRGLGTFNLGPEAIRDKYDDLSDLSPSQIDSIKEWEAQFAEKYELVGNLLKPGDEPNDYSLENIETN